MNKTIFLGITALIVIAGGGYYLYVQNGQALQNKNTNTINQLQQAPVTSGENPLPGSTVHDLPVEPAAAIARKDLAAKLSVNEKSIVILQITEETWSDGCLGLGGPAESCLAALVPGFKVEMQAQGKTYIYRTDKTGTNIRAEVQ